MAIKTRTPIPVVLALALSACLPNPEGPALEAPGTPGEGTDFLSNYSNIQINGDFSGISWEPDDPTDELKLVGDNLWSIWVSVNEADISDGEIHFKFTHDHDWADNFEASDVPGQAEIGNSAEEHIIIELDSAPAFYEIWLNDETLRYSDNPQIATGTLGGTLAFDGAEPQGSTATLRAESVHGDAQLWTVAATRGQFQFANLADSVYTVEVTVPGYGTSQVEGIRVEDGQADPVAFHFEAPLDGAMPDQPWMTPIIDGILEGEWREVYNDGGHVGIFNVVDMDYDALYASWDGDSLYLAASGNFAGTWNSLSLFIDADYGEGTGVTDLSTITGEEEYIAVVNHLNKAVDFAAVSGFGAEFATSTLGHSDPRLSSLAPDGTAAPLGRGAIAVSETALELALPWSLLYPELGETGPVPPFAQIAVFAIIGNSSAGGLMSDDTLPLVDPVTTPDAVVEIVVDGDGE